jgi:two-component sensor histidine kinase
VHHRIANQLGLPVATIRTQIATTNEGPDVLSKEAATHALEETAARIIAIAQWSRQQVDLAQHGVFDLANLLVQNCAELGAALSLADRVRFSHQMGSNCCVNGDEAPVLGLVVGEIVMNAVKYAHPTGIPVEIVVACSATPEGRPCIEIYDDGVGLPQGFDEARDAGGGLKIIRSLVEKIGAELSMQSSDLGLSFHILLPFRSPPAAIRRGADECHPGVVQ